MKDVGLPGTKHFPKASSHWPRWEKQSGGQQPSQSYQSASSWNVLSSLTFWSTFGSMANFCCLICSLPHAFAPDSYFLLPSSTTSWFPFLWNILSHLIIILSPSAGHRPLWLAHISSFCLAIRLSFAGFDEAVWTSLLGNELKAALANVQKATGELSPTAHEI